MLNYLEGLATGLVLLAMYSLRVHKKFRLLLEQVEAMKCKVAEQIKLVEDNLYKLKTELGNEIAEYSTKYIDW
jgi:hypothetical protein